MKAKAAEAQPAAGKSERLLEYLAKALLYSCIFFHVLFALLLSVFDRFFVDFWLFRMFCQFSLCLVLCFAFVLATTRHLFLFSCLLFFFLTVHIAHAIENSPLDFHLNHFHSSQPCSVNTSNTGSNNADDTEKKKQTPPSKKPDSEKPKRPVKRLLPSESTTAVPPLTRFTRPNQTPAAPTITHALHGSSEMLRDLLAKLTNRDSTNRARTNAMNAKRNVLTAHHPFSSLPPYNPSAGYTPYHPFDPLRPSNSFLHGHSQPDYGLSANMFLHAPRQQYMPFPTPAMRTTATDTTGRLRPTSNTEFAARKVESQIESLSFDMFCRCHQPVRPLSSSAFSTVC